MQELLNRIGVNCPCTSIANTGREEFDEPLPSLFTGGINQHRQPDGLSYQFRVASKFSIVHTARWSGIMKFASAKHATSFTFQKGHFATYFRLADKSYSDNFTAGSWAGWELAPLSWGSGTRLNTTRQTIASASAPNAKLIFLYLRSAV